ncbi:MAG: hypothetical protein RL033_5643 [Pseudomonadota bacterium]|jgi:hypothetical protein
MSQSDAKQAGEAELTHQQLKTVQGGTVIFPWRDPNDLGGGATPQPTHWRLWDVIRKAIRSASVLTP